MEISLYGAIAYSSKGCRSIVAGFGWRKLSLKLLQHMGHTADGFRLPESLQLGEELWQLLCSQVSVHQQALQSVLHTRFEVLYFVCAAVDCEKWAQEFLQIPCSHIHPAVETRDSKETRT